jgi:hypothetical protein
MTLGEAVTLHEMWRGCDDLGKDAETPPEALEVMATQEEMLKGYDDALQLRVTWRVSTLLECDPGPRKLGESLLGCQVTMEEMVVIFGKAVGWHSDAYDVFPPVGRSIGACPGQ